VLRAFGVPTLEVVFMSVDDDVTKPKKLLDPLDVPNLNQDEVFWFMVDEGIPTTRWMVKQMFARREVHPVRLGNSNYVSRRQVLEWVESRRQPGNYRLAVSPDAVSE
jgi:hypothetical protein